MNSKSTMDWVQILTGIAVFIGLALVVWELQQTKSLTRAQLVSDGHQLRLEYNSMIAGETASDTVARACVNPESITVEDALILEHVYFSAYSQVERLKTLQTAAGLEMQWEVAAQGLPGYYDTPHGRWWWSLMKNTLDSEIVSIADPGISGGETDCGYLQDFAELKVRGTVR